MAPFIDDNATQHKSADFAPWSVEEVLEQLNIDEKVSLLAGKHRPSYRQTFALTDT